MRAIWTNTLALGLALSSGCDVFYSVKETGGVTKTTFDETLPTALEEVFGQCTEPLDLEPGLAEIDLLNGCTAPDVDSAGAQALVLALTLAGPIELADPLPTNIASGVAHIDNIPWPMQNCEVDLDYDVRLDRLRLLDLDSWWMERPSGKEALRIDFDFPSAANAAEFRVVTTVDCPSPINELALNAAFDVAIPSGWRQITLSGLDLDLYIELEDAGDDVNAELKVLVAIGDVTTDTYLSALNDQAPGLDDSVLSALGLEIDDVKAMLKAELLDALSELPDQVADLINGELPEGHTICSLAVSQGDLIITTDVPGVLECVSVSTDPSPLDPGLPPVTPIIP